MTAYSSSTSFVAETGLTTREPYSARCTLKPAGCGTRHNGTESSGSEVLCQIYRFSRIL